MRTEIFDGVGCPHFFLDYHPNGFYEMIYDDEVRCVRAQVHLHSFDDLSESNWISLGRNFVKNAILVNQTEKPTLH